jgi:hypothetical protein
MTVDSAKADAQYELFQQKQAEKLRERTQLQAEAEATQQKVKDYYAKKRAERRLKPKPIHLIGTDGAYVCSTKAQVHTEQATDDPAKSTCEHCNAAFMAYHTNPFFAEKFVSNRGLMPNFKEP